MAVETELKLRISPEYMARLKRHPFLHSLQSARAVTRKLHSVYYDTPDLYLHKHAMALRLRRVGRQWLQTLKGGGAVQAGLHQRNEWESAVPDQALDFAALEASGAMHLPKHVRKELQAVFVTDFSRNLRLLNFEGASIELSMDSGEIRAGQASRAISELELELKSGEPLQLFKLALLLLDVVPLEVEPSSKAEYGYALWAHSRSKVGQPEAVHSKPIGAVTPELKEHADVSSALQSMIWSCLLHLQANVQGAVHKPDDEYLHQVRVAIRRLRVALGMASTFRSDAELTVLSNDIAALGLALGHSREWDVFVTQTLAPVHTHLPKHPGLKRVLRSSQRLRQQHHARVQESLQAQSFQKLLLRFGAWMNGSYWHAQPAKQAVPVSRFATQVLQQRCKQVNKRGGNLHKPGTQMADADVSKLHALRISCKKLRYSLELFAALHADGKARHYVAALAKLQDTLGVLNDIAVARRLLDELGVGAQHEATVLIRGWIEHDYADHLAELHKAWKKFSGQKVLWN